MSEPKRTVVKGFEDWTERIKAEVVLKRPNNEQVIIPITAVSEADRMEITSVYRSLKPAKPKMSLDRAGNVRNNAPNAKADEDYADAELYASNIMRLLYIEKGCGWDIPGKNNDEKLAALRKKVPGEIDLLYTGILSISRLTDEDVGFF